VSVDAVTAARIGWDWLRAAVAPAGAFGRRYDETASPYAPGDERRAGDEIAECVALAQQIEPAALERLRGTLRAVPEPTPIVVRAQAGDVLGDVDFYELARFADALDELERVWNEAGGSTQRRPPRVERLRALLGPGRDGGGFYLSDAFGEGLRSSRAELLQAENALELRRRDVAERVRDVLGIVPAGDEFVVMRELHPGPLPPDLRLVREGPAYRVVAFALETGARDDAFTRVAAAEEAARRELSLRVAAEHDDVISATRALGALDHLLARAAFARRWGGCVPELTATIAFEDGVFAPLAEQLAARGRHYTPLSLELPGVAVLTGPNMGGKSAALATAGFLCACVALGVPPPARAARLPLLERIVWLGGDDAARQTRLLSSYADEIVRARDILATASQRCLLLVDEFARTTGPREGRALLIAVLEALRSRGAFALAATHFDGVAEAAHVSHLRIAGLGAGTFAALDADDLDAALDAINAAMDYRIVAADAPGSASDAFALAELLGFDRSIVARARALCERPGDEPTARG
jgi:hypothetical protein